MQGKLYLVATPIGNLDDITLRAIKVLKESDLIAAEDTRHTLKLLNHLEIKKPLISYYKENEIIKSEVLIEKLLEGKNIALVSDAGTPAISDPGSVVVKRAIEEKIEVVPIPGACALINALITSGINTQEFSFLGFLPVNKKEKREKLNNLKEEKRTLIFYESPHKLIDTLNIMLEEFGERNIVLARELTKIHEEFIRDNINELINKVANIRGKLSSVIQNMQEPRGEFVVVVEGSNEEFQKNRYKDLSLEEHYKIYENQGLEKKEIIKKIAKDRNTNKNEIYKYFFN